MSVCDIWTGPATDDGYGYIYFGKKRVRVHRAVWMQDNGTIPDGMVIMHTCDTPRCINVEHLRLGTQGDNIRDMVEKGRHPERQSTHCTNGHPFSGENLYLDKTKRRCRECNRARGQRHRDRKKAA